MNYDEHDAVHSDVNTQLGYTWVLGFVVLLVAMAWFKIHPRDSQSQRR